ncbi:MAG TPA: hypothetical protein VNZ66_03185 [Aeromicrobium sp.]|nr:hypothetical protein [Aeromicrobium sp.]
MGAIGFATSDDAVELVKALNDEGYTTDLRAGDVDAPAPWVLTVDPFDDRVVEMVDVYGGWIPGDEQRPE